MKMKDPISLIKEAIGILAANKAPLLISGCCLFAVLLFLYFFYLWPAMGIGPEQPIPFSHRVHNGVKQIQCEFCHPYVGRSTFPGIPPVEKCLYCHNYIIANHPEIKKEHAYFNTNTSTPWRKVTYIPEHVFFNHQRHIKKEVACRECHGPVETMDRLKSVHFKMGFCIECHRAKKANVDCWLACHN
ncbi:MAG: cytochrome c3 family protein [Pseudomonadota bacterium]